MEEMLRIFQWSHGSKVLAIRRRRTRYLNLANNVYAFLVFFILLIYRIIVMLLMTSNNYKNKNQIEVKDKRALESELKLFKF